MQFNAETRVGQIALANPASRRVLEDAGIDYCCGGGKSLQQACSQANVAPEEILNRLHQHQQRESKGSEEIQWTSAPLSGLTRHIRERHHHYVREAIPRIETLVAKVREKHEATHPELKEIERLFREVADEMQMHMQKEEHILFPCIDSMESAAQRRRSTGPDFFPSVRSPIQVMMAEHDSAGDLVRRIRQSSRDYQAPEDACTSYRALYQELHDFEADLHLHVHLENNILFPRAIEMEAASV